ncbi:MAG: zinc-binding alcohol dehydrogenase [Sphaerochaeta sp.]|nr:zinc-binding alcohol dehydrogenase [Sphaerochaeta sp.]
MYKKLSVNEKMEPCFREVEKVALAPNEVLIQSMYGSPKHGTELTGLLESPFSKAYYDETQHIFKNREKPIKEEISGLGNMWVGTVVDRGNAVKNFALGELVAGYGVLAEYHNVAQEKLLKMPPTMSWQTAVCFDPLQFALGGVRDAHIRVGDRVLISGLGAIGMLAAKVARLAGASLVAVSDPVAIRREIALKAGADLAFDPIKDDYGLILRDYTQGRGLDAVIETSASYSALQQGLRALAYGGTLASVGWFKEREIMLHFGLEGHFNQQKIVFSRACSDPNNDHPRWSFSRIKDEAWELLSKGLISGDDIVTPIVPFSEAANAYRDLVMGHADHCVKLGVDFTR